MTGESGLDPRTFLMKVKSAFQFCFVHLADRRFRFTQRVHAVRLYVHRDVSIYSAL